MQDETVFSDDPAAMGSRWESEGASMIHVVDLDGAVEKTPRNLKTIEEIIDRVRIPVQVGGGIRDMKTIEMYFERGVSRVVIGTEAIRTPALVREACGRFPGRIVIGIDARNGCVAIEGWTQQTQITAVDLARRFEDCGAAAINFTDIVRDGMRSGPNLAETKRLAEAITIPVVASGGVSSLEDIADIFMLEPSGVVGVIVGRALYDGSLDLQEAIKFLHRP